MKIRRFALLWFVLSLSAASGAPAITNDPFNGGAPTPLSESDTTSARLNTAQSALQRALTAQQRATIANHGGYVQKAQADIAQAITDVRAASAYVLDHPEANALANGPAPAGAPQVPPADLAGHGGGNSPNMINAVKDLNAALAALSNNPASDYHGPIVGDINGLRDKILADIGQANADVIGGLDFIAGKVPAAGAQPPDSTAAAAPFSKVPATFTEFGLAADADLLGQKPSANSGLADAAAALLPDGRVRLYFTTPAADGIQSALSADGQHFTLEPGVRLPGKVGQPSVVAAADGAWRMFFTSKDGIGSAISQDGLAFTLEPGQRMTTKQAGVDDYPLLSTAAVVPIEAGSYRMYFSTQHYPGTRPQPELIKSATSSDMLTWTLDPGVRVGPGADALNNSAERPFAIRNNNGAVRLFYGRNFPAGLFSALADDGLDFQEETPVGLKDAAGLATSIVRLKDGAPVLYYTQNSQTDGDTIHLAKPMVENQPVDLNALKQSLVLYFGFNAVEPDGKVTDLSGHGNNGTAVGAHWVADLDRGKGFAFSGTGQAITVPNNPSLNPKEYTLSAWIKTTTANGSYHFIFEKGKLAQYALRVGGAEGRTLYYGQLIATAGNRDARSGSRISDGKWHQAVCTFDGGELDLYLDGKPVGKPVTNIALIPNTYDLTIGCRADSDPSGTAQNWSIEGTLDDLMMFNRALSAGEIQALCKLQTIASANAPKPAPALDPTTAPASGASAADRLKAVKALFDQGLITREQYDAKVKEIMDSL